MLEKADFIGLYISKEMIPDCIHNDNYSFNFYNRNGIININVRGGTTDNIILIEAPDYRIESEDNNDKFKLIANIDVNHPYKVIQGKLYIKVPEPKGFKLFLNEYGWRYFEKID